MPYFAYILERADQSHYVGSTADLEQRVTEHITGNGAVWTSRRRPVKLIYSEAFDTPQEAARRERQWKKWTRAKRQALIDGDKAKLKNLSRRRNR